MWNTFILRFLVTSRTTVLPSVRQLATDLQINPNTVAKAYSLLDREGIVEAARRRGTVVTASAPDIARKAVGLRVEETADRVLEEIASLGVDVHELLEALERRLDKEKPENTGKRPDGRSK